MRKVEYCIIEEDETTTGDFKVSDMVTEDEIMNIVFSIVAVKVHGNNWSVSWEFVD